MTANETVLMLEHKVLVLEKAREVSTIRRQILTEILNDGTTERVLHLSDRLRDEYQALLDAQTSRKRVLELLSPMNR